MTISNKIFENIDQARYSNQNYVVVWEDPIIVYRVLVDDLNNRYVNLLDGQKSIIYINLEDYVHQKKIILQELKDYFDFIEFKRMQ